jgi:hypothetical protein
LEIIFWGKIIKTAKWFVFMFYLCLSSPRYIPTYIYIQLLLIQYVSNCNIKLVTYLIFFIFAADVFPLDWITPINETASSGD